MIPHIISQYKVYSYIFPIYFTEIPDDLNVQYQNDLHVSVSCFWAVLSINRTRPRLLWHKRCSGVTILCQSCQCFLEWHVSLSDAEVLCGHFLHHCCHSLSLYKDTHTDLCEAIRNACLLVLIKYKTVYSCECVYHSGMWHVSSAWTVCYLNKFITICDFLYCLGHTCVFQSH